MSLEKYYPAADAGGLRGNLFQRSLLSLYDADLKVMKSQSAFAKKWSMILLLIWAEKCKKRLRYHSIFQHCPRARLPRARLQPNLESRLKPNWKTFDACNIADHFGVTIRLRLAHGRGRPAAAMRHISQCHVIGSKE